MMAVGLGCVFKRQLFPICVCVLKFGLPSGHKTDPPFLVLPVQGSCLLFLAPR